jgi:hypothetical protein
MIIGGQCRKKSGLRIGFLLRALALLSFHIPYLVHAEKQYQHKYTQLYPHAHRFTFLKTYSTTGFFQAVRPLQMQVSSIDSARLNQTQATNQFPKCCKKSKKNRPAGRFFCNRSCGTA